MLSLSLPVDIYLAVEPADMRKAFDGLFALAVDHLGHDPLAGGLFVFLNRRRDRMKLLYWDADGLAIWAKKHKSHYPHFLLFTEIGRYCDNLAHRPAPTIGMDSGPPSFGPRRRPMPGEITVIIPPRAEFAAGPYVSINCGAG